MVTVTQATYLPLHPSVSFLMPHSLLLSWPLPSTTYSSSSTTLLNAPPVLTSTSPTAQTFRTMTGSPGSLRTRTADQATCHRSLSVCQAPLLQQLMDTCTWTRLMHQNCLRTSATALSLLVSWSGKRLLLLVTTIMLVRLRKPLRCAPLELPRRRLRPL